MTNNKQLKREARQLFRLCLVDGLFDETRVRRLVQLVLAAGYRRGPALLGQLSRLVRLDRAQHAANIESAAPLSADLRSAVRRNLTHRYGPGLSVAFAERPSLIGGLRIQVGSNLYDGSVLARLQALEKSF